MWPIKFKSKPSSKENIVVGIDIGTHSCGFCINVRSTKGIDIDLPFEGCKSSPRYRTRLSFNEVGELANFGDIPTDFESTKVCVEFFKQEILRSLLEPKAYVTDIRGFTVNTISALSKIIKILKDKALCELGGGNMCKLLDKNNGTLLERENKYKALEQCILWVVAFGDEPSKPFLLNFQAACAKAGITADRLCVISEVCAAAKFCEKVFSPCSTSSAAELRKTYVLSNIGAGRPKVSIIHDQVEVFHCKIADEDDILTFVKQVSTLLKTGSIEQEKETSKNCSKQKNNFDFFSQFTKDNTKTYVSSKLKDQVHRIENMLEEYNKKMGFNKQFDKFAARSTQPMSPLKDKETILSELAQLESELKELLRSVTKDTDVNQRFSEYMENFIGHSTWETFKSKYLLEYKEMVDNFEYQSRAFATDETICIIIPSALHEINPDIHDEIKKKTENEHLASTYKADERRLYMHPQIIKQCLQPSVDRVIHVIEAALSQQPKLIPSLVVVGGFAESPYVQKRFKVHFKDRFNVVFPVGAINAVQIGAALYID